MAKLTLRETVAVYKTRLNVVRMECHLCDCDDYIPKPPKKFDRLCAEPWPACLCGHLAKVHDPNFKQ